MTRRLIVGNLDCESAWAGSTSRLPQRVRRRVAAASTLLRVFARPEDRLWMLEPVRPERLLDGLDLARPGLVSGLLEGVDPAAAVLAWGETPSVAQLRARAAGSNQTAGGGRPADSSEQDSSGRSSSSQAEWLWGAPRASAESGGRICNRAFQLALARRLGLAFDSAARVDTIATIGPLIRAARCDRWVLKAPYSAAGRDRVLGRGEQPSEAAARQAAHLLERFGQLIFEPWVDRLVDFSSCVIVETGGVRMLGLQQQSVHANGGFQGVVVWREPSFLSQAERETVDQTAQDVGWALHADGFRGPFGIDGWCYRGRDGERLTRALGEINPRLTFGFVARELAELAWRVATPQAPAIRLQLGSADELPPASATCWPLLAPGPADDTVAWVEAIFPA